MKVRINEINIKRKINLGNYESIEIGASISPSPAQSLGTTIEQLAQQLDESLTAALEQIAEKK